MTKNLKDLNYNQTRPYARGDRKLASLVQKEARYSFSTVLQPLFYGGAVAVNLEDYQKQSAFKEIGKGITLIN